MALSAAEIAPGFREIINDKFVVGVDLGQSMDPTAICVLQHRVISHLHYKGHLRQVGETFDVRHLQRLPLGLSYPEQVDAVAQLLARPPLGKAELVIDETGVGRAVGDLFESARLSAGTRHHHRGSGSVVGRTAAPPCRRRHLDLGSRCEASHGRAAVRC